MPTNPCEPSPCGPYSVCRVRNKQAICSCQTGYFGTPPSCRPECLVSSECSLDKACVNQKCQDPCPGVCGLGARCQVNNHNPICSCPPNYIGDPFVQCKEQGNILFCSITIFLDEFFSCSKNSSSSGALCTLTMWCQR